jgi:hypothetical protein
MSILLIVAYELVPAVQHNQSALPELRRRRYWPWILAGVIATAIAWGPVALHYVRSFGSISGTADIPAGKLEATIRVPASLPYAIHILTPDWEASGVFVTAKESGRFSVAFNRPPPPGGGVLDWEVIPRSGVPSANEIVSAVSPTPIALPRSRWLKLDDATKWHFMQWMRAARPPQGCIVVIAHYATPYAQGVNAEFREILDYADWQILKGTPNEDFPMGVSVISPKSDNADPVWICAVDVQNGLRQFSDVPVPIKTIEGNAKTPNMSQCANRCVEVDIGNEPEPTPTP